jgi:hypothetical protein
MGIRIVVEMNVETASVEDLYLARGILRMIDSGFTEDGIEPPEAIIDQLSNVNSEITNRNRAELNRRLKAAKARRSTLLTREEKSKMLDDEIAQLEQKLGSN